jgi:hypothetical protein
VRLRPVDLTLSPDAITSAGFPWPMRVGLPSGGEGVTLQGVEGGDSNDVCTLTTTDGLDNATGYTQETLRLGAESHLADVRIDAPAAVAGVLGGVGADALVRFDAGAASTELGSIRRCTFSFLSSVETLAAGLIIVRNVAETAVGRGAKIEDCKIAGTSKLEPLLSLSLPLAGVVAGGPVGATAFPSGTGNGFQPTVIRRCAITADYGIAFIDHYGPFVEDVNYVMPPGADSAARGVYALYQRTPADAGFSEASIAPRIKNLDARFTPAAVPTVASGNCNALDVELAYGGNGVPAPTVRSDLTCLVVDGLRTDYGAPFAPVAGSPERTPVRLRWSQPDCGLINSQLDNIVNCDCGVPNEQTLTMTAASVVDQAVLFTIDDGVNPAITWSWNDDASQAVPANTATSRWIHWNSNAPLTDAQFAAAVQAAINGSSDANADHTPVRKLAATAPVLSTNVVTYQTTFYASPANATAIVGSAAVAIAAGQTALPCLDRGIVLLVGSGLGSGGSFGGARLRSMSIEAAILKNAEEYGIYATTGTAAGGDVGEIDGLRIEGCGLQGCGIAAVQLSESDKVGTLPNVEDAIVVGNHLKNSTAPLTDHGVGTEAAHNIL